MTTQLATTALTEFWPDGRDLIMLGEWCLSQSNVRWRDDKVYQVLPYHFDNGFDLGESYKYCSRLYEEHLEKLGEALNIIHGIKKEPKYWRIILGPWLYHYVQVLYDRYLSASQALRQYPDLETVGLYPENFAVPHSTWEAIRAGWNDNYNLQLFTQIFRHLGARLQWRRQAAAAGKAAGRAGTNGNGMANWLNGGRLAGLLRTGLSGLLRRGAVWTFRLNLPASLLARLLISLKFKAYPLEPILYPLEKGQCLAADLTLRCALKNELKASPQEDDPFPHLLAATIPENLPLVHLEGYAWLVEKLRNFRDYHPKVMISAVGFEVSDPWNFLAAEKAQSGTKLIGVQHGGAYGTFRIHPIEDHEEKIVNEWWTWGWRQNGSGVARPVPHPKLSELAKKFRTLDGRGEALLILVNRCPRYLYRLWSNPMGPQGNTYRRWLIRFLEQIADKIPKVILRLHHNQDDVGLREHIRKNFPWVTLDDYAVSYYERLKQAAVVVSDNNHTTFLESLAAGKPTVIFWDPQLWGLRPEAEPYFQMLQKAGIFFDSPEAAAAQVVSIFGDPGKWWSAPEVERARECVVNEFACAADNWPAQWRREFNRVLYK